MAKDIKWHKSLISHQERNKLLNHKSFVIWFTGLSGSGKSSLAFALEKQLHDNDYLTYCLDGDNLRHHLNGDLGFSDADRKENVRRIAEVAALLKDAGVITLVSCISPHQAMREYAKQRIGAENFIEVYVKASVKVCQQRDTKGLYAKATTGETKEFTGISSSYEEPEAADITLHTDALNILESVSMVLDYLENRFNLFQQSKV